MKDKVWVPLGGGSDCFLNELGVNHEVKNMTSHPQYAREVKERPGECVSPTVADASVELWL